MLAASCVQYCCIHGAQGVFFSEVEVCACMTVRIMYFVVVVFSTFLM